MAPNTLTCLLAWAALASAGPLLLRAVTQLDEAATAEAHPRDDTATRAFSNVQIKASDGRCLFIDKLSGDFRANLTPVQLAECGSTEGQGWDIITSGAHISGDGGMLIVSTLTQACFNFDPRRQAGNQVILFSCGGRADGGGDVTDSQIFSFNGTAGRFAFEPRNQAGSCLTVNGDNLDVADCNAGDVSQSFTFGGAATGGDDSGSGNEDAVSPVISTTTEAGATPSAPAGESTTKCTKRTRTVVVTASEPPAEATPSSTAAAVSSAAPSASAAPEEGDEAGGIPTANPTTPVPVSRAGGTLQPTAAAESHQRDETAVRAFEGVSIRDPNGQCLSVDPTAGDFRQNLIPVSVVDCTGAPNEKWDIITQGRHNDAANGDDALVVSSLTQGCLTFDGRRQAGDTVTLFSCGGRADGSGETSNGQLFPFLGQLSFAFAPLSERNTTCILPGSNGRLESGECPTDGSQLFSIFP